MVSAMTLSVINRETCSVVLTVSGAVMTIHEGAQNCTQSQGNMSSIDRIWKMEGICMQVETPA